MTIRIDNSKVNSLVTYTENYCLCIAWFKRFGTSYGFSVIQCFGAHITSNWKLIKTRTISEIPLSVRKVVYALEAELNR